MIRTHAYKIVETPDGFLVVTAPTMDSKVWAACSDYFASHDYVRDELIWILQHGETDCTIPG